LSVKSRTCGLEQRHPTSLIWVILTVTDSFILTEQARLGYWRWFQPIAPLCIDPWTAPSSAGPTHWDV